MTQLFQLPKVVPLSAAGLLMPGAKLYFFQTGTTTPQNTYQDADLTTPHSNPVVADANGVFAPIYLDGALPDYRVRLTTSADVQIYQVDGVPSSGDTVPALRIKGAVCDLLFEETDASDNNDLWRVRVNSEQLAIALLDSNGANPVDILQIDRSGTTCDTINLLATNVQANSENVTAAKFAFKSSSTDRSSTTTLADDPDLQLTLQANASYRIDVFVLFTGVTTGTQGFKYAHAYSGTLQTTGLGMGTQVFNSTASVRTPFTVFATNSVATIAVAGNVDGLMHSFFVRTDTTGTLSFQWAQNSSDVNATRVVTGSYICATRLG